MPFGMAMPNQLGTTLALEEHGHYLHPVDGRCEACRFPGTEKRDDKPVGAVMRSSTLMDIRDGSQPDSGAGVQGMPESLWFRRLRRAMAGDA
jgi:hypothetical protein